MAIGTEFPAYTGGYLLDNYIAVQRATPLTKKEWLAVCRHAAEGAFASDDRRLDLANAVEDYFWDNGHHDFDYLKRQRPF